MDAHVFRDPRVQVKRCEDGWKIYCRSGPVVSHSRELWKDYEDQPQVDASFPGLQFGGDFQCYQVTVQHATKPDFPKKGTTSGAVSFKLGWAYEDACFHPGRWDERSWSISGTGNVCCDAAYQRPWFFADDRSSSILQLVHFLVDDFGAQNHSSSPKPWVFDRNGCEPKP